MITETTSHPVDNNARGTFTFRHTYIIRNSDPNQCYYENIAVQVRYYPGKKSRCL